MAAQARLRVVIVKPSKYAPDGSVERFRWGFMPNSTIAHLRSMTPEEIGGIPCETHAIDESVRTKLDYLELLDPEPGVRVLLALVGVQSHQFHRALDLAALARARGASSVIGGPHPMTCDTAALQNRGVSFAVSEAELVWPRILAHAAGGELLPLYGEEGRWQARLEAPVLKPPSRRDLARYVVPMLGVYPARGCPYSCNFCSVVEIAGHAVRGQPIETTLRSLEAARTAGVRLVMFTSDNFNKYPDATALLTAMVEEKIEIPFFVQCDAQIHRQPELVELLARAGCFQIFVGAESFDGATLRAAHKFHNTPEKYREIVRLCREHGITSHFSNILGFPGDTEASIARHVDALRGLSPDVASFYILTPIPGTEQYDDFRRDDWITEPNLDRYDGSCVTWRHPNLPAATLTRLLFRSYRDFFSVAHTASRLARLARRVRDFRRGNALFAVGGYCALSRWGAFTRTHPMAGGVRRVRADSAADYRELRRRTFGLDLAPLPGRLRLTEKDEEANRRAKLTV